MPAQKDFTVWQEVEGDHGDDVTYVRVSLSPTEPHSDEQRTSEEAEGDD